MLVSIQLYLTMSSQNTYEPPVTEVIELMQEGIVCASGEVPDMEHGWDLDMNMEPVFNLPFAI